VKTIILFVLLLAAPAFAGFGGSRGGGSIGRSSSFGASRSSFGGSRSVSSGSSFGGSRSSSSATVSRPSSWTLSNNPTVIREVPVYHSSDGFWRNMFFWHMLTSNNSQQPVVVQTGGGQTVAANTIDEDSHGFFYYLLWTIGIIGAICAIVYFEKRFL
jgi:hypothetical protein